MLIIVCYLCRFFCLTSILVDKAMNLNLSHSENMVGSIQFSSLKLMEQPRDWPRQASASNSRSATPVLDKSSPSSAETIKAIQKIETQQRNSPRSSKPREHLSAERIENSEPIIRSLRAIHLNNGEKCQR